MGLGCKLNKYKNTVFNFVGTHCNFDFVTRYFPAFIKMMGAKRLNEHLLLPANSKLKIIDKSDDILSF